MSEKLMHRFSAKLFDSGLSCYETKYWSKDTSFRKLDLMEFDDNGWAVVHHMVAADKPLLNQVRIFCDADKNLLSLQTRDQFKYTPLLLACHHGKVSSPSEYLLYFDPMFCRFEIDRRNVS